MFNRYFGNKVKYEEIYVDNNGDIKYKPAVNITGSLAVITKRPSQGTWLHNQMNSYKRRYRVPFEIKLGSKINDAKVVDAQPVFGLGRLEYWFVNTLSYDDILVCESDLTMTCTLERKIGVDSLRCPVYGEPETVKTWYFENREIFKPNENGVITSHTARGYVFIPSVNLKKGDKIDGYIVEEINNCPSIHGVIDHIEAYVCK